MDTKFPPDVSALAERVLDLERQARRMKRGVAGLVALLGSGLLMSMAQTPSPPEVVKAQEFRLVDADGKARAYLGMDSGSTVLVFSDQEDVNRLVLAVLPDGSSAVILYDREGNDRVVLKVGADGASNVNVNREGSNPGVALALDGKGNALVAGTDAEGNVRFALTANRDGSPSLQLYDEGTDRLNLGLNADGTPTLTLSDKEGRTRVAVNGADADDRGGHILIMNKTGERAVTVDVDEYGNGQVGAWNRNGKGRTLTPGPR